MHSRLHVFPIEDVPPLYVHVCIMCFSLKEIIISHPIHTLCRDQAHNGPSTLPRAACRGCKHGNPNPNVAYPNSKKKSTKISVMYSEKLKTMYALRVDY